MPEFLQIRLHSGFGYLFYSSADFIASISSYFSPVVLAIRPTSTPSFNIEMAISSFSCLRPSWCPFSCPSSKAFCLVLSQAASFLRLRSGQALDYPKFLRSDAIALYLRDYCLESRMGISRLIDLRVQRISDKLKPFSYLFRSLFIQ